MAEDRCMLSTSAAFKADIKHVTALCVLYANTLGSSKRLDCNVLLKSLPLHHDMCCMASFLLVQSSGTLKVAFICKQQFKKIAGNPHICFSAFT